MSISKWCALWCATLFVFSDSSPAHEATLLETINQEVCGIYEKSKDAVVKVHAQRQLQIGNLPLTPSHRVGTGFFIDEEGHILTAATVVDDADSCWIDWQGQRVSAQIIGRDPQTNLAVLRVDPKRCAGPTGQVPTLTLGNSDELRVGSMVIAVGFPYDLPSAPAVGFVSGLDIQRGARVFQTTHIRAGCKLSPGQGGGPLFDVHGEVVGIAVAAHMDDQCYAFPINAAKKVVSDILLYGAPQYGWVGLGISERQLTGAEIVSNQWQVFVQQVYSNTPAFAAGFQERDVLLQISSNEVTRTADVLNKMFYCRAGDKVTFTVLRAGQRQQLSLVVGAKPQQETVLIQPMPRLLPVKPVGKMPVIVPAAQEP